MADSKKCAGCIILTGMPGVGKTTIGMVLAKMLDWAFLDTDNVIESLYAARLQEITDALGKDAFLDVECGVICSMRLNRCVVATGGSVVYRKMAVAHLGRMGPMVYLQAPLEIVMERIALKPDRGIAIAPGQTLEELFEERRKLYQENARYVCQTYGKNPEDCAAEIAGWFKEFCGGEIGKFRIPCAD